MRKIKGWKLKGPRNFPPRKCKLCSTEFTPVNSRHQLCAPCSAEHNRKVNVEYSRAKRKGLRLKTRITVTGEVVKVVSEWDAKVEPKPALSSVTARDEYDDLDRRMEEWWERMYGNYTVSVSRQRKSAIGDI